MGISYSVKEKEIPTLLNQWCAPGLCPGFSPVHNLPASSSNILRKYGIHFHCYTDDTQFYLSSPPSPQPHLLDLPSWTAYKIFKLGFPTNFSSSI